MATWVSPASQNEASLRGSPTSPLNRPPSWRAYSESGSTSVKDVDQCDNGHHSRRKSAHTASVRNQRNNRRSSHENAGNIVLGIDTKVQSGIGAANALQLVQEGQESRILSTPPTTPDRVGSLDGSNSAEDFPMVYDFSKIDYELDRTRSIGKGLWSTVFLAQPTVKSPRSPQQSHASPLTPPPTPQKKPTPPSCRLYAVKLPHCAQANAVFQHEAKILTTLQRRPNASSNIIPFHGLDPRNSSLIFEAALGGSLEDLTTRLKVMTEVARHLELRALFPELAADLTAGLAFIHASGIVHADVKPANVLLDIAPGTHSLRARYIDFSASFARESDDCANAGGTWDFMAPEQLRVQRELNTPTFASDVWSLGTTLFSVIVGGSPYAAAAARGVFMLRDAVKGGEPLGFARMDGVVGKRMAACQDFVDCCRLALQKDRERRIGADDWRTWVEEQEFAS